MKFILVISLTLISSPLLAREKNAFEFLKSEAQKSQKDFIHHPYENIFNGALGFLVGNIGYFSTSSKSLKLAYSAVQTIGILNVGTGVYDNYRPILDKGLYEMVDREGLTRESLSKEIVQLFAKEERAKRLQLFWTSTLLGSQYLINAYLDDTQEDLEDIYKFLAGVNLIAMGYSYFYKQKYEAYYFKEQASFGLVPILLDSRQGKSVAAFASLQVQF